jgi:hypothetical protein
MKRGNAYRSDHVRHVRDGGAGSSAEVQNLEKYEWNQNRDGMVYIRKCKRMRQKR